MLFARMNAECAPEQKLHIYHSWRVLLELKVKVQIYFGTRRTSPIEADLKPSCVSCLYRPPHS